MASVVNSTVHRSPRHRRSGQLFLGLFAVSFPALRFREKLGENNGMIHDPITRCIYQCFLPRDVCRKMSAVAWFDFSSSR